MKLIVEGSKEKQKNISTKDKKDTKDKKIPKIPKIQTEVLEGIETLTNVEKVIHGIRYKRLEQETQDW